MSTHNNCKNMVKASLKLLVYQFSEKKNLSIYVSLQRERETETERESPNIIFYWNLKVKTEVTEDISF